MSNNIQKGTQLVGGAATEEALASSPTILKTAGTGQQKGLQQFFTPEKAATLAHRVIGSRVAVLDPTAGDGSFLRPWELPYSYGVEIDPDQIKNATESPSGYHAIQGDIQHVFPLLALGLPTWEGIVCNPPFGLMWEDPNVNKGKPTKSDVVAFEYCMRLLAEDGQLVFIDGKDSFYKNIANRDSAKGIYAVIECDDLGAFHNHRQPCIIAFGLHPGHRSAVSEGYETRQVPLDMLDLVADWVIEKRTEALSQYNYLATSTYGSYTLPEKFETIQKEATRRSEKRLKSQREYDASLNGGKNGTVQWLPSNFCSLALSQTGDYYSFNGLNGQSVNYFINNERLWIKMIRLAQDGLLRIDPRLSDVVEDSLREMRRTICPLYEIKPQQRLAYLSDLEVIKCVKDDDERGFTEGTEYRIQTDTETIIKHEERVVESKKTPGEYETKEFRTQRKVMKITLSGMGKGMKNVHHTILDGGDKASEGIAWLIKHFELPDPGDVSTRHPEEIAEAEKLVREVFETFLKNSQEYEKKHPELTPFTIREFQVKDIARMVFKEGGLLSWEQGLGKTVGGLAFMVACTKRGAQPAGLIITAKDLIPQWQREMERFLGKKAVLIKTHGDAHRIAKELKVPGSKGLYITYYEALSIVGTKKSQAEDTIVVEEREEMKQVKGTDRYAQYYMETVTIKDAEGNDQEIERQVPILKDTVVPEGTPKHYGWIRARHEKVLKQITSKEICPQCRADTRNGWNGLYCEAETESGGTCGYAHYKVRVRPISSLLSQAFRHGTIIMDEITLIQGDTSKRSKALRGMAARHKLGMTGTPIKNFVGQAFWLLWWALGNGSKRFGYVYDGGRTKFENDFSVVEWGVDRRGRLQGRKALPEVTNLSRLWRLLASSIIRRRKEETGEELVPKYFYPIHTPLGVAQREQIDSWLNNFYLLFEEKYPNAPIVKAGMHKLMAPMLGLQQKLDYACTIPLADPDWEWTGVEGISNFTPSTLKVMELTMALVKDGRKVLVGSNLVKTSKFLAESLQERDVRAIHILDDADTTLDPNKRAQKVYSFQTDEAQVFCAGVKAIRLGHNLDAANAVVLHGLDWDYETLDQFINRVHRLTSKEPIDIYVVLPTPGDEKDNTITTKKWSILEQKGDAASLALDGRLIEKMEATVDQKDVIRELMERGLASSEDDIPEAAIEEAWHALPSIEEYEVPADLLPARPIVTWTEEQAAEVVEGFIYAYGEGIREQRAVEVVGQFLVHIENIRQEQIEAEKEAAEAIGSFLQEFQHFPAVTDEALDSEEIVADATMSDESPPDEVDPMAAMMAQMEEMKALLAAQQAEIEQLRREPEQLSLRFDEEEAARV